MQNIINNLSLFIATSIMTLLLSCSYDFSCTENEKRCTTNGDAIKICTNGDWKIMLPCEDTSRCSAESLKCESIVPVCDEGKTQCADNGKLMTCIDNTWVTSDCDTDHICRRGQKACELSICNEHDVICNNTQRGILTCTDNKWLESSCPPPKSFCEAEQCVVCINGQKRCKNNAVEFCADNNWTITQACDSKSCDVSNPRCIDVQCKDGWQRCNGNFSESCQDNEYTRPAPDSCGNKLYCLEYGDHSIACVACTEDKHCLNNYKCIGNQCQNTTPNEPIPQ